MWFLHQKRLGNVSFNVIPNTPGSLGVIRKEHAGGMVNFRSIQRNMNGCAAQFKAFRFSRQNRPLKPEEYFFHGRRPVVAEDKNRQVKGWVHSGNHRG